MLPKGDVTVDKSCSAAARCFFFYSRIIKNLLSELSEMERVLGVSPITINNQLHTAATTPRSTHSL